MFHLLEKIRTQTSRAQRNFIAFSVSLLFTGLIFVGWIIKEKQAPVGQVGSEKVSENTPTDTLVKNIRDTWKSLVDTTQDAQDTIKQVDFSSEAEYSNQATSTVQ